MKELSAERALIFRITHIDNLDWIVRHGLRCRSDTLADPNFVEIGRPEIINRRLTKTVGVPPGGTLSDYVPFYFTSRTPMLLNIKSGWQGLQQYPMSDIVILITSLRKLAEMDIKFVFTDRTATLVAAQYYTGLSDLQLLPWDLWTSSDFKRDDQKPDKVERYLAEALIHNVLPIEMLTAIACYTASRQKEVLRLVSSCGLDIPVSTRAGWYC